MAELKDFNSVAGTYGVAIPTRLRFPPFVIDDVYGVM